MLSHLRPRCFQIVVAMLVLAATGAMVAAPSIARAQAAGVALVIGNSKYQWEASLPNVRRDVPDIAKRFEAMGLKTELLQDANRSAMTDAIERFGTQAKGSRFAAFYFAGHGAAWVKDNYLVPIDADLSTPNSTQSLVPVASIARTTAGAANRLVVYDNCRNNPADGWRQTEAERRAAFLRDFRSTLIVSTSIPVSVIGTFALLYFGGFTLNTMTFGGLALGIGMIVDAAIVVLENTHRHLHMGKDRMTAAIDGTVEVIPSVISSVLTTVQ